ncbi:hypothetical protein J4Q44_G00124860 [Coregonus suidteri]|uniref:Uncharacterized protein n=1 Tax=Coregonus suidteri TaxID=861788 RepID=A0AAN8MGZ8_9TELE
MMGHVVQTKRGQRVKLTQSAPLCSAPPTPDSPSGNPGAYSATVTTVTTAQCLGFPRALRLAHPGRRQEETTQDAKKESDLSTGRWRTVMMNMIAEGETSSVVRGATTMTAPERERKA